MGNSAVVACCSCCRRCPSSSSISKLVCLCLLLIISVLSDQTLNYIAEKGITDSDVSIFSSQVSRIKEAIHDSFQNSLTYAEMAFSFLMASNPFPGRIEFNAFASSKYWDPDKTINGLQWAPLVLNSQRDHFETLVRREIPRFTIFNFTILGNTSIPVPKPSNSSSYYYPILYCYPLADSILGLDLNDDVEGPWIDRARASGEPASAVPFLLRGLGPSTPFHMGMTVYLPAYFNGNGSAITYDLIPESYAGCVVAVFLFRSMIASILDSLQLVNYDVFLFYVDPTDVNATNAAATATYVAHYESPPADDAPGLSPAEALRIRPENVTGDIVTAFDSALDVLMAGRIFRVQVRARAGSLQRDVVIYGGRFDANRSSPHSSCPHAHVVKLTSITSSPNSTPHHPDLSFFSSHHPS